jgi:signal transduction histidine kinase
MKPALIRLLLIEDNPADALLLKHSLAAAGDQAFEVTEAALMSQAVERLAQGDFDAVLLDLSLPDSRGIRTVAQANAAAPHLPIIVMTGLDDEATALEAVRRGAQDFLIKGHTDGRLLVRSIHYAVERKQAEQQLKALNETLEQRVAERTATATRRAAQLQELASELTRAEHRERRRLAKILHDHLQQLLYAARLNLETLRSQNHDRPPPAEALDRIDSLLGECIAESRSLTVQLSPPVLYEAGLTAAIEWLARHMHETCGLTVTVETDPRAEPENEEVRLLLFEAARELLFNVAKHARTRSAEMKLTASADGDVELTIADDGAGFVPSSQESDKNSTTGFGLFSIRERLELMGGRLQMDTAPGRGTRATITASIRGASS